VTAKDLDDDLERYHLEAKRIKQQHGKWDDDWIVLCANGSEKHQIYNTIFCCKILPLLSRLVWRLDIFFETLHTVCYGAVWSDEIRIQTK